MGEANRRKKLGLYPEKINKPKPKKIKLDEIDMVTLLVLLSRYPKSPKELKK